MHNYATLYSLHHSTARTLTALATVQTSPQVCQIIVIFSALSVFSQMLSAGPCTLIKPNTAHLDHSALSGAHCALSFLIKLILTVECHFWQAVLGVSVHLVSKIFTSASFSKYFNHFCDVAGTCFSQFSSCGSEGLFVQFVVCDLVFPLAVCRCPHHQIPPFLFSQYSTGIFTELVCDVELKSLPAVGMKEVINRTADIRKSLTWSNVVRVVIQ